MLTRVRLEPVGGKRCTCGGSRLPKPWARRDQAKPDILSSGLYSRYLDLQFLLLRNICIHNSRVPHPMPGPGLGLCRSGRFCLGSPFACAPLSLACPQRLICQLAMLAWAYRWSLWPTALRVPSPRFATYIYTTYINYIGPPVGLATATR